MWIKPVISYYYLDKNHRFIFKEYDSNYKVWQSEKWEHQREIENTYFSIIVLMFSSTGDEWIGVVIKRL